MISLSLNDINFFITNFKSRRFNNKILYSVNLCQIKANIWNFVYIGFEEEQTSNGTKMNCKVKKILFFLNYFKNFSNSLF
jgi:hypothetical protein